MKARKTENGGEWLGHRGVRNGSQGSAATLREVERRTVGGSDGAEFGGEEKRGDYESHANTWNTVMSQKAGNRDKMENKRE